MNVEELELWRRKGEGNNWRMEELGLQFGGKGWDVYSWRMTTEDEEKRRRNWMDGWSRERMKDDEGRKDYDEGRR